jgi:alcohol dehydrogenase (cytochrome c)
MRRRHLVGLLSLVFSSWLLAQNPPPPPTAGGGGGAANTRALADPTTPARVEARLAPLNGLTPVTAQQLLNPPPGDWLHWRRTYNGHGVSPLSQINRNNVKNLKVAWTWSLAPGVNESAPLVHDGIMYVWNYGDRVQALDAKTGNVLWQYTRELPSDITLATFLRTKKHLALAGNKLILPTTDVHLIALDAKSGTVLWDTTVADYKLRYAYNAGPLIIRDKVLVATTNCSPGRTAPKPPPDGCFISAHDLETGKELWRFNTIPKPGEPGGDSWNNLPPERRNGAALWTSGSYDPELNLTYWGTGQPYPWVSMDRGTFEPEGPVSKTHELLYTNSTLALNPDTGKLVWHFAHLPNDSWDQDYAFERIVINIRVNGRMRKAVVTVGKPGIVEVLDAATGEFIYAKDMGTQTMVKSIDPVTGAKTLIKAEPWNTYFFCPTNAGSKSFQAGSYDPATKNYYFTLNEICMRPGGGVQPNPITPDGEPGRVVAVNLETREVTWQHRERSPQSSAVLATAGGLVFVGTMDRYFRAHDDRTGKILWETRLNDVPNAFPITYAVGGKQYIAMIAGYSGINGRGHYVGIVPEIGASLPPANAVLWVWELN